jgi:hypothetical protein
MFPFVFSFVIFFVSLLFLCCLPVLCSSTEQPNNKERASRQTHTQGNNKNNEEKHKWKHAGCDHVKKRQKKKAAKQNPSSI